MNHPNCGLDRAILGVALFSIAASAFGAMSGRSFEPERPVHAAVSGVEASPAFCPCASDETVYRCIKCVKKLPKEETEIRGHAPDDSHAHPGPCQLRMHKECGTVVFENKNWDARGRAKDDKELPGLAAQCGTEIPWVRSLEEARRLSRDSRKPIAWWVTAVEGSPTDRKLVLEKYMLSGPFMMPAVVHLLARRFVPCRCAATLADRQTFGTAPLDFVEPGVVFLNSELQVLHKADRITTFSEEWFVHLLSEVLRKAGQKVGLENRPLDAARRALAEGRPDPSLFERLEGDEARYLHGVALHLVGRDEEGRAEWKKLKEGRWAWKAAAELAGDGPFVRGFEIYESLAPDTFTSLPTSTTAPRPKVDVRRAVRFLVGMQRATGAWTDCNYNFGGDESLPNVYMAVTAIGALALREWGEPAEIEAAIRRAERYMKDEAHVAPIDADEVVWGHLFRLLYFARTGDREMTARLVRKLADLQMESGIWYHEYPASFTSAMVLHALGEAKAAGADVPDMILRRGAQALGVCRNERGVFSYHFPSKKHEIEGSGARLALCEYALFRSGYGSVQSVTRALEDSFKVHERLERVRKYDNHADPYGNAGFFFWYGQYGRAVAARAVGDDVSLNREKEVALSTQEIDGCWVDSHELGRVYGTAMALLTLKLCR